MEHSDAPAAAQPTSSPSSTDAAPAALSGPIAAAQAAPGPNGATLNAPSYVYVIGTIEPRFPRLSVEKEFVQLQARGATGTQSLTDRQVLQSVLARPESRYLARKICWVMTIEGLENYILVPRDSSDLSLLIEAVRPNPRRTDVDIAIGIRGPMAPPDMCNGLIVPIVAFDQLYSFDVDTLIRSIPNPNQIPEDQFTATAEELLARIMQIADNAGATDEHRALNYLAVRYPAIYTKAAEQHAANASLAAIDVLPSRLSGVRKVVDVIFSFTDRGTDVTQKSFVRVDITEEFPFLVTKLSPYYDR